MSKKTNRVIATLTTIPSRVPYLYKTIESITRQDFKPDAIELNIPSVYRHRNLGSIDLSTLPRGVDVYRCEDFGPATKLLPTLKRYEGQDVYIIYCDDDRIYDSGWISRLVRGVKNNPNSCIADEVLQIENRYNSIKFPRKMSYRLKRILSAGKWKPRSNNPYIGQIAEGFGGVIVKPSYFDEKIFDIDDEFLMVDDIWISAMLSRNKIPIRFSGRTKEEKSRPVVVDSKDLGRAEDSLVQTRHQGLSREELDWRAINLAKVRYGVWEDVIDRLTAR